ncbi:maltose/moltooligosaccharide transporter [Flavobacteriaceae bacterium MAR_2010_72]|nr:maltose/moltooligosaccharide transporter [Flavobacteriaceae bacterium MAR_2010_72]TVZ57902.1 maltose/moltooligosaccharide transporter [Flavobacteriaceae bacterium MAR_2010_105]
MKKRKLGFWEIWNMSFGFLGIQFGFALQNANTSRIFETLGAQVDELAVYWLAAPLTGLIVQPIVGYFSDRTWHKTLGRRRPYFLVGAILASIALCLMPNSPILWMAIGVLWIMDASINITMEPFRAFVGDNLPDRQRTLGFAMQSFFIGIGGFVGSSLPYVFSHWFNISSTAAKGVIPDTVKYSFYFGAIAFFLAVLWTVVKSKEYTPEEFEAFEKANQLKQNDSESQKEVTTKKQSTIGIVMLLIGLLMTMGIVYYSLKKDLYILSLGIAIVGFLFVMASSLRKLNKNNGFVDIMTDLLRMPTTMKQLAPVQFFSWFAMFSMWIYATSGVTSHIYGTSDTTSSLYNEGADWVGFLMGIKFLVAALVAFLIPILAKVTNRKVAHLICLSCGGLGLISFYFISNPDYLLVSMIGIGIAWASILSVPYALLTSALPLSKMGYYMGVFNFFIVIPQIVAASLLGFMLNNFFNNEPIYALIVGGISMILSGLLTLAVTDKPTIQIDE